MGFFSKEKNLIPEIGSEIPWTQIIEEVFKVKDFDRNGTVINENGKVIAKSIFKPYGYLIVESPILNMPVRLPIVHKDDFKLAKMVFDDSAWLEKIDNNEWDLLVTYIPKTKLPRGLSGSDHGLHYTIVSSGKLDEYYSLNNDEHMSTPDPKKLFDNIAWDGEIRIGMNLNKLSLKKETTKKEKTLHSLSNSEIISIYHKIKNTIPEYNEPNYDLAKKVFFEFNDFNLRNLNELQQMFFNPVPRSLLPYPKNYIKCAYYLFFEERMKEKDFKTAKLIEAVGFSLFSKDTYPDYNNYKKLLLRNKEWENESLDKTKSEEDLIASKRLLATIDNCRKNFKKIYGVYEVSESDYYASPSSVDCSEEKLIYDFGTLPKIEKDLD